MRAATSKVLPWLAGAVALFAGYEIYQHTKPPAQRAQIGDDVFVDASKLPSPIAALPPGTATIDVQVGAVNADGTLSGTFMGVVTPQGTTQPVPIAAPIYVTNIPRAAVTGVKRAGIMLT